MSGFIVNPDELSHVADRTMGSLSSIELDDVRELWLRTQIGWMPAYHLEFYAMLLRRIDDLRAAARVKS